MAKCSPGKNGPRRVPDGAELLAEGQGNYIRGRIVTQPDHNLTTFNRSFEPLAQNTAALSLGCGARRIKEEAARRSQRRLLGLRQPGQDPLEMRGERSRVVECLHGTSPQV